MIGEQENLGLELALPLDGKRLRGHIALHRAVGIGEEGLRIEGVGFHLRVGETKFPLEPLEVGDEAFLRDEQRRCV